jgi:DNA (cytosine-5)-methyltransferase 1
MQAVRDKKKKKSPKTCVLKIERKLKNKTNKFNDRIPIIEIGGKNLLKLDPNKEASLTHYLHNSNNGVSKYFKSDALDCARKILEYKFPKEKITFEVATNALQYDFFDFSDIPFLPVENPKFKFIDLFAGIGGFRIAMQNLGGKCVFTSEWDNEAKKTYKVNFGEIPFGDITKEKTKKYIPDGFDLAEVINIVA